VFYQIDSLIKEINPQSILHRLTSNSTFVTNFFRIGSMVVPHKSIYDVITPSYKKIKWRRKKYIRYGITDEFSSLRGRTMVSPSNAVYHEIRANCLDDLSLSLSLSLSPFLTNLDDRNRLPESVSYLMLANRYMIGLENYCL